MEALRSTGARIRILFLDARDRRRARPSLRGQAAVSHPLAGGGQSVDRRSIERERELLEPVKGPSPTSSIDTSDLNVHQLREHVSSSCSAPEVSTSSRLSETSVISFGYKHGLPPRRRHRPRLPVPPQPSLGRRPPPPIGPGPLGPCTLRHGPQPEDEASSSTGSTTCSPSPLPGYVKEGKSYLSIAVGCTGGRHRSVVLAGEIAGSAEGTASTPPYKHRDIERLT